MDKKYWVPALEKANDIVHALAEAPSSLKLIDLSRRLDINKSSMFSLLNTLETLEWVVREDDGTYSLGSKLGLLGSAFFKQYSVIDMFRKEVASVKQQLGETIQLAKLEQREVLYLAKEEGASQVRLASEPGMKMAAHVTALGKALLAYQPAAVFGALYAEELLAPTPTPHTIRTKSQLAAELDTIRRKGCAFDLQEAVTGFSCVAAPIFDAQGQPVAAISCSMIQHVWEEKQQLAQQLICEMAKRMSHGAHGHTD
jgi:DNA-binding IclR family transcriptional regulator